MWKLRQAVTRTSSSLNIDISWPQTIIIDTFTHIHPNTNIGRTVKAETRIKQIHNGFFFLKSINQNQHSAQIDINNSNKRMPMMNKGFIVYFCFNDNQLDCFSFTKY